MKKFTKHVLSHKPGFRFRKTFVYMRRKYGANWFIQLAFLGLGIVLFLAGVVMLVTPGPGWVAIILGLIVIACVSYRVARQMDKAERKIRHHYERFRNKKK